VLLFVIDLMMTSDDYEHVQPSGTRFDLRRENFDLHTVIRVASAK
jgi:hypothetical protein